jgi:hypothetical protein
MQTGMATTQLPNKEAKGPGKPKVQNLFIGWAGAKQLSDLFKDFRCCFTGESI